MQREIRHGNIRLVVTEDDTRETIALTLTHHNTRGAVRSGEVMTMPRSMAVGLANMIQSMPDPSATQDAPQCDYQHRILYSQNMTRCEEPAKFDVRIFNHVTRSEYTLKRCSQHGEALREILKDRNGWTQSMNMRILAVEPLA